MSDSVQEWDLETERTIREDVASPDSETRAKAVLSALNILPTRFHGRILQACTAAEETLAVHSAMDAYMFGSELCECSASKGGDSRDV